MWLIVGLGNPGSQYQYNRHNIGFMAVDEIIRRHNFSTPSKKFQAIVSEGTLGGEKVLLMKPQTFMNLSGQAVQAAAAFYKVPLEQVIVFHDELDLAAGKIRTKIGGGAAGHNGLRSMDEHLGPDYWRVRLGIGHPGDKDRVHSYVLGDFAKGDENWLTKLLEAIGDNAERLVKKDMDGFMSKVSQALAPPRPEKPKTEKPIAEKKERKMTKALQNKVALVTGASKGLGKAIALRLARDGAAVIVNYASDKAGAEGVVQAITKDGGKAYALQGDVSKVAAIKKMFTEIDGILKTHGAKSLDILVNNAGVFPMGGLEDATEETFDKIFNTNVKGLFFTTQEAAKRLSNGGRIVNISTGLTRFTAPPLALYSASKGAVDIMTRDFAATLGARGITVNAVHPGLTATEGTSGMTSNKDMVGDVISGTALGRLGQPDDIADAVAFFCSNDARWTTAQHLEASGGVRL